MGRREPSLIPQWLKGPAGSAVGAPHLSHSDPNQDGGGGSFLSRHRILQQLAAGDSGLVDYDLSRSATSSDLLSFPSPCRGESSSSSSVEKTGTNRDRFSQGRCKSGFSCSSSIHSYDTSEEDQDGVRGDSLQDWVREDNRDLWSGYREGTRLQGRPEGQGDLWNSALAEGTSLNGNVQSSSLTVQVIPISTPNVTSATHPTSGSAGSMNALNMAEALTQNPPRVCTHSQLSIQSQRLEDFALKQSRQLIPMIPSLPKTMSLVDKAKTKTIRTIDGVTTNSSKGNQSPGSFLLNSSQRSFTPSNPDTLKVFQGKLLVLKPSRDGGTRVSISPKPDGSNAPHVASNGNTGATVSTSLEGLSVLSSGVIGQRKQMLDCRDSLLPGATNLNSLPGLRTRGLTYTGEDKRPSLQAQNRSEFFNALRKKAAGNGNASLNAEKSKTAVLKSREFEMAKETITFVSDASEGAEWNAGHSSQFSSKIFSNGDKEDSPSNAGEAGRSLVVDNIKGNNLKVPMPGTSEEEEAAFMRSLGWEENTEDCELTEEEIRAFYQMRERRMLLNSIGYYKLTNYSIEQGVGSSGSVASGHSSSDSKYDDQLCL